MHTHGGNAQACSALERSVQAESEALRLATLERSVQACPVKSSSLVPREVLHARRNARAGKALRRSVQAEREALGSVTLERSAQTCAFKAVPSILGELRTRPSAVREPPRLYAQYRTYGIIDNFPRERGSSESVIRCITLVLCVNAGVQA